MAYIYIGYIGCITLYPFIGSIILDGYIDYFIYIYIGYTLDILHDNCALDLLYCMCLLDIVYI